MALEEFHKFLLTKLEQSEYQKELNLPEDSIIQQTNELYKLLRRRLIPLYYHYRLGGLCIIIKKMYYAEKCRNCTLKDWIFKHVSMRKTCFQNHARIYKLIYKNPQLLHLNICYKYFLENEKKITLVVKEYGEFWKSEQFSISSIMENLFNVMRPCLTSAFVEEEKMLNEASFSSFTQN